MGRVRTLRRLRAGTISFAPPGFDIGSLAQYGTLYWADPSDLSTLFQDTAGTVPVTAAGQNVARINCKGGTGLFLSQATAGKQPIFRDNGTLRWLEFDLIDDCIQSATSVTVGPYSTFIASAMQIDAATHCFAASASGALHTLSGNTSGRALAFWRALAAQSLALPSTAVNSWPVNSIHVASSLSYAGFVDIEADKGAITTAASAAGPTDSTSGGILMINGTVANTSSNATSKFYGGIYLMANPGATDRNNTITALGAKAGLAL